MSYLYVFLIQLLYSYFCLKAAYGYSIKTLLMFSVRPSQKDLRKKSKYHRVDFTYPRFYSVQNKLFCESCGKIIQKKISVCQI